MDQQDARSKKIVNDTIAERMRLAGNRVMFESQWDEIARLVWPNMKQTFRPNENTRVPGERDTQEQLDSSPQLALGQFAAILDSLLTPRNAQWHKLMSNNKDINKDREVQLWFEQATDLLFNYRYAPYANFSSQNQLVYKQLGAFGTGPMYIDQLASEPGLRYKSCGLGECYIKENHQGIVDHMLRYFPLTPAQAKLQFGEEAMSPKMLKDCEKPDLANKECWFIHCVKPQQDYHAGRLDSYGKPFVSYYIDVTYQWLISEGGYTSFPYVSSRYEQAPGEVYGRSPAMTALPSVKTLMAMKRAVLKQAHRTVDPVLLTPDDGILDEINLVPGATNRGGMTMNGQTLVGTIPIGRVDVGLEMMDKEREAINASFLVHLFQILTDTPTMTATEVIERTREKGILLAPTIGRQQSEYLGPLIDREIDLLVQQRLLPPMPQLLIEAKGEYQVVYDSPLSRTMRAEHASGAFRTIELAVQIANATGDPSHLDRFDFDTIIPEVGDINGMPPSWMKSDDALAQTRQARAEQVQAQQAQEAKGANAALLKATGSAKKDGLDAEDAAAIIKS